VALRAALRAALAGGMRRMMLWADAQGAAAAVFPAGPPDPFVNVNTPGDLDEAERLMRGAR
jgi:molybdopterin-guanine dinucleotide biosynthesis protein A